jgi:hypothetical protein
MRRSSCSALIAFGIVVALLAISGTAQTTIVLDEGWESGTKTGFDSQVYGRLSAASQFSVQQGVRASGSWALRHLLSTGVEAQYATQHFGDSITGPTAVAGRGQSFQDVYVQWKIQYSPGFDFGPGYKQFIIGTQDNLAHTNVCCNPWVSHYITIYTDDFGVFRTELNNKQSPNGQWGELSPNQAGYSSTNRLRMVPGVWYTVEIRRRLNDVGDNGIFQLWLNGQLISDYRSVRYRVPWNGTYGANYSYGTNFAMISDWSNPFPSQSQSIYYDDVKISSARIGTSGSTPPRPPTNVHVVR